MKTLDACVGDLIEYYNYKDNIVTTSVNNRILLFNDKETYIVFDCHWIIKNQYQRDFITVLPRKIK